MTAMTNAAISIASETTMSIRKNRAIYLNGYTAIWFRRLTLAVVVHL